MRVLVEQKGIDLSLALATPQDEAGKATVEVNLNRVDLESLSYEAIVSGEYRFTVRAAGLRNAHRDYKPAETDAGCDRAGQTTNHR